MKKTSPKLFTLLHVAEAVCHGFSINNDALCGRCRSDHLVCARIAFYSLARRHTSFPNSQIAKFLNRDPGNLLNYSRKRDALFHHRPDLLSRYQLAERHLLAMTTTPAPQPTMTLTPTPPPDIKPVINRDERPRANITQIANACRHMHQDLAAFASEMDDVTFSLFLKETSGHLIDIAKELSTERQRQGLTGNPIDLSALQPFDFWTQPTPPSTTAAA